MARRSDRIGEHRTRYDKNRAVLLRRGGVCGICGQPVDTSIRDHLDPMAPVIDHIIPIAKGGHPSDMTNLQLAHRWCNRQKSDKLFDFSKKFSEENTEKMVGDFPQHADWANYKCK